MSNYKITYSNELYHHGIKGQKWGIRRFRNEDGSLTQAGKERYNNRQKAIENNNLLVKEQEKKLRRRKKDLDDLEKNGVSSSFFKKEVGAFKAKDFDEDDPDPERTVYGLIDDDQEAFESKEDALKFLKGSLKDDIKSGQDYIAFLQRENSILMNAPINERTFLENAERGKKAGIAAGIFTGGGALAASMIISPALGLGFGLLPSAFLGYSVGSSVEKSVENLGVKKEYRRK